MITTLMGFMLTTFISVNGQVQAVPADSPEAAAYAVNAVTDIGDPEYLTETETTETETTETETTEMENAETNPTTTIIETDNSEEVALLSEAVELLGENSSSVTGTVNSSVLDLMDRMTDSYPAYYKHAGFRTSADDSYNTTLYIAKRARADGNKITFSEDCICINFARYASSGYSSYVYYDVTETPFATVDVTSHSIVYTDVLDGYPTLGTKEAFPEEYLWIALLAVVAVVLFLRRSRHD